MQEQNSEKIVSLSVRATKMTARVLKAVISEYLKHQKNKQPKVYKGKQSVNFNIRPTTTAVSNMCVDGNKKRPVICIDGEKIAEDSTGASDEASDLHILDTPESVKSSYLSNEILENPLFSKNLSLIHRLHRRLYHKDRLSSR